MACAYIFTNRVSVGSLTYIQSVRRISLYMCILYYIVHIYNIPTLYIGNLSYMINYCATYVHTCIFIYASIVCVYLLLIYRYMVWYHEYIWCYRIDIPDIMMIYYRIANLTSTTAMYYYGIWVYIIYKVYAYWESELLAGFQYSLSRFFFLFYSYRLRITCNP